MKKFHVNMETGKTGVCIATKEYPFGLPIAEHFNSENDALISYERTMSRVTHKALSKIKKNNQSKESSVPLDRVIDLNLLSKMVKRKYVNVSVHPKDKDLKILSYTKRTQLEGKWNSVTRVARGLIIRSSKDDLSDAKILQRPWEKFYTLQQLEGGWALGDEENATSAGDDLSKIDFKAPAEVTDKLDGSLGILYKDPTGKIALSTKGNFDSVQAKRYTRLLRENENYSKAAENLLKKHPDKTFMFELIGGNNRVVIDYGSKEEIVFLGANSIETGIQHSPKDFSNIWSEERGLKTAEIMKAKTAAEAFGLPNRPNREGLVIRILSDDPEKQIQLKIKQDDYKRLHNLKYMFSKSDDRALLRDLDIDYEEVLSIGKDRNIFKIESFAPANPDNYEEDLIKTSIKERKDRLEEVLFEKASHIQDAIDYIDSIPKDTFKKPFNDFSKEIFTDVKTKNFKDEGVVLECAREVYYGEDPLKRSAKRMLSNAVRKM